MIHKLFDDNALGLFVASFLSLWSATVTREEALNTQRNRSGTHLLNAMHNCISKHGVSLGFDGAHPSDIVGILHPFSCNDDNHNQDAETMLKRPLFIATSLFFSATLSATPTPVNLQFDWMQTHYTAIDHHLATASKDAVIPEITTLIAIWKKRDGAVSGEVSPLLITALTHHTEITLAMFASSPVSYEKWLEELEGIVFTDLNGDQFEHLTAMKQSLTHALTGYVNTTPTQSQVTLATQLLTRIEAISVSQVD